MNRPGIVAANPRVKEVRISDSERFVICSNPEAAERDAKIRERMVVQLEELIKDSGKLSKTRRAEDLLFKLRTRCIPRVFRQRPYLGFSHGRERGITA